ncbi:dUTP diphosphatase [Mycoplasmopsis gallinacea]|uniref:Uncharacterized protein conserved in bacteria n=1 Tax=Mycoplasmopsis gallinacea TaxID=29556 RepID=A0A449A2Q5_9BACT|nr:dUTP diphosphatase [Mycoplasmopsis gallinacea]VEU58473.1 Uncharacterized protein conserved in bacteria [Mycoplasmopsis gallinacea]
MNLSKIFEMQKDLDKEFSIKTKQTHPDLTEQDIHIQRTLALIVEAGEFINEVQSFKYWKINKNVNRELVLEEFADLVHFFVNFANTYNIEPIIKPLVLSDDINIQFQKLFLSISKIMYNKNTLLVKRRIKRSFRIALGAFVKLGFTYDDLFEFYKFKNEKNYQRIKNNY